MLIAKLWWNLCTLHVTIPQHPSKLGSRDKRPETAPITIITINRTLAIKCLSVLSFVSAESDICTFALLKTHYKAKHEFTTSLFGTDSRPQALKALYEAASKTPVHLMRQMDRWRRDGHRSSRFFLCTPVLGAKRRRIRNIVDIDIETRMVHIFFRTSV